MTSPYFCTTCGTWKPFPGGPLCTNCLEVQGRIEDYLTSPNGRKFVSDALGTTLGKAALVSRLKQKTREDRMNELQTIQTIADRLGLSYTLSSEDGEKTLTLTLEKDQLSWAFTDGETTALSLMVHVPKEDLPAKARKTVARSRKAKSEDDDEDEDNDMSVEQIIGTVTR